MVEYRCSLRLFAKSSFFTEDENFDSDAGMGKERLSRRILVSGLSRRFLYLSRVPGGFESRNCQFFYNDAENFIL